jgi:hypothetical protein
LFSGIRGSTYRLGLFENRVLRRTSEPKREEITGCWRKLHSEGLYNLYPSPNIITTIKSKRMRWKGYVARMGEKRNAFMIFCGKIKRKGARKA